MVPQRVATVPTVRRMPARNEVLATTKLEISSPASPVSSVSRATVPSDGSTGPSLMLVLPPAAFDPTVLDRVTPSRPGNEGHGVTTETIATLAIPNVAHGPALPDETGELPAGRARALIVLPAVTRLRARRAKGESPRTRHHRARLGRTFAELARRSA